MLVLAIVTTWACGGTAAGSQLHDQPAAGARSPRNASYDIDVRLDHARRTLHGARTHPLAQHQRAPDQRASVPSVLECVAQRRFDVAARTAPRRQHHDAASRCLGFDQREVDSCPQRRTCSSASDDLTSLVHFIAPDDGNTADRTVMAVPLPAPVAPERDDRDRCRMERDDPDDRSPAPATSTTTTSSASGSPRSACWKTRAGTPTSSTRARSSISDYGVYDVRMTVPRGFVVGASGQASRRRRRRRTARPFTTTTAKTSTTSPGRRAPFRRANADVRASHAAARPDATAAAARTRRTGGTPLRRRGGGAAGTTANGSAPTRTTTSRSSIPHSRARAAAWSIRRCSRRARDGWRRPTWPTPEAVTIHEAGHQFWYGVVGSNEFEHAWMDEGINEFSEARADEVALGAELSWCAAISAASFRGSFATSA